ncbi:MAG: ABC transporter ATP-binding protein [Bacillota bacterium]|nr:ABC transporter ATP-binding protein [Bacillota bacterium]
MNQPVLEVRELKKHFPIRKNVAVRAVDGVSFELREGEILGLVGESGSGKSTVAYTVVGMYRPTAGQVIFRGEDVSREAARRNLGQKGQMQIVFQDPGSSLNPRRTVRQILRLPLMIHGLAKTESEKEEKAVDLLRRVELPEEYLDKYPSGMGGGERQLVAIARALATSPSLIIFDEPTSALDVSVQAKVINRLVELHRRLNLSYLFITHDLSLMRNVSSRVAIMYLGVICEVAETKAFFTAPRHPYTHMLLSSIPVVSDLEEELKPRKVPSVGEIPSPVNIPRGCRFHPRCPEAVQQCREAEPQLRPVAGGTHLVACHRALPD